MPGRQAAARREPEPASRWEARAGFSRQAHVDDPRLRGATDLELWDLSPREAFTLVSKDDDFRQLGLLRGAPPKVPVLAIGNGGNQARLELPASQADCIAALDADASESVLVLRTP